MALINENPYVDNQDIQRIISILPNQDISEIYINSPVPPGLICMDILHGKDNKNKDVPILKCPSILLREAFETNKNILRYLISDSTCHIPYSMIESSGPLKLRFRYDIGYPLTIPLITIKTVSVIKKATTSEITSIKIYHIDSVSNIKSLNTIKCITKLDKYYSEIYKHLHKKESPEFQSHSSKNIFSIFPMLLTKEEQEIYKNLYITLSELWIFQNNTFAPIFSNSV